MMTVEPPTVTTEGTMDVATRAAAAAVVLLGVDESPDDESEEEFGS